MKKNVSYNVKLVVDNSSTIIKNCHCECPSGKGPHSSCKHVVACLIVLSKFVSSGLLHVAKTCTETLQTFNAPKKRHTGAAQTVEEITGTILVIQF